MRIKKSRCRNPGIPFLISSSREDDAEQIEYLGISIIRICAGILGIWGLSCLVSGLMHSNGIKELGASWISAIIGV